MTDYPDWHNGPQDHANSISTTGVPLLSLPSNLINDSARNLAASGVHAYNSVSLTQLSYVATVQWDIPNTATVPYLHVNILWSDSGTSQLTGEDNYYIAGAPASPGHTTLGSGPAKGNIATITVTNLDPAQAGQVNFIFSQDSMVRDRPLWHWQNSYDTNLTVPGFTNAHLPVDENCLGNWTSSGVSAGTTANRIFGMAPGRLVTLAGSGSGVVATSVSIRALPIVSGVYSADCHLLDEVLSALSFTYTFVAPRCPIQLQVSNNATSGTFTMTGGMFYQD